MSKMPVTYSRVLGVLSVRHDVVAVGLRIGIGGVDEEEAGQGARVAPSPT